MTKPVLAFAHANGVPGGSYARYLNQFADDYTIAPLDLGLDRWPVGDNWNGLLEELEAFLEPLPKPILGMGHSMGAVLMFKAAVRHPDWFSELVMLDPPLVNGWGRWLFSLAHLAGQMDRLTPAAKSMTRRDQWPDQKTVNDYFNGRGMFKHFDPQCLQDYIASAVIERDGVWRLRVPPVLEVEIFRETPRDLHRFTTLAVPGVIVNGSITHPGFVAMARRHVRQHKMTHVQAPGSHMFPLEKPQAAAAAVKAWLNGRGD